MLIVVKIGTSTLTSGTRKITPPLVVELARQMTHILNAGHRVILVSSGAIAAGREKLGFPQLSKGLPAIQMLAAIGQPRLMVIYEQIFALYDRTVAQVLLTRADLADRRRYINARSTLTALIVNALPAPCLSGRLQSASGEELSALMPSSLAKAFKGGV